MKTRLSSWYKSRSDSNLYSRFGAVSLTKAIPLGLQHVLVMFLANIAPILVVYSLYEEVGLTVQALQAACLMAGIGTLIQLYPVWRFGSGLPIFVGVSITFTGACELLAVHYDYYTMMGSLFIGGIVTSILGLLAPYWRRFIKPVVSSIVVISIGLALIGLSAEQLFALKQVTSLNGGTYSFALAWPYLLIGGVGLASSVLFQALSKGHYRNLYILVGFIAGYISAIILHFTYPEANILNIQFQFNGEVSDIISFPELLDIRKFKFDPQAILFVIIVYIVASTEGVGDMFALAHGGMKRAPRHKEIAGGLAADGLISSVASLFGTLPFTISSQNVGFIAESKIINKFTIAIGAVFLVLMSFFPPVAYILEAIPVSLLGGCTLLLFGSIFITGISMFEKVGLTRKNILILCLSLGLGYGSSILGESFFNSKTFEGNLQFIMIFFENPEVNMFLLALIFSYIIPDSNNDKTIDIEKQELLMNTAKEEHFEIPEEILKEEANPNFHHVVRSHNHKKKEKEPIEKNEIKIEEPKEEEFDEEDYFKDYF